MSEDVGKLFELYHEPLVRMLVRRTGDRDRAEDLAQETFARAVAAPPRNPRPWLFAVALNLVREEGRKAVRQERRLVLYRAEQDRKSTRLNSSHSQISYAVFCLKKKKKKKKIQEN